MPDNLSDLICITAQDVNKTIGNEYATVTRVNTNKTVNVKPDSNDADSDDLTNISYVVDLDLSVGDKVVLSYLNNDPNEPIIIGMLNPKSSSNVDCRSIVSIDKVESDGLVDVYRITYDKSPFYSYFSVKNGAGEQGGPGETGVIPELAGKTVRLPVLIEEKVLPAGTTTATFSNLNGDLDEEYLLEADFKMNTTDATLAAMPNGVTTGFGTSFLTVKDGTSTTFWSGNYVAFALAGSQYSNINAWSHSELKILAKTGKPRLSFIEHCAYGSYVVFAVGNSLWKDTTTNITSLVLTPTAGTFEGTFRLYKMVDVTYPTN